MLGKLLFKCATNMSFLQTLTSYSSILSVVMATSDRRASETVNQFGLMASAANFIQVNCAHTTAKMGIPKCNRICLMKSIRSVSVYTVNLQEYQPKRNLKVLACCPKASVLLWLKWIWPCVKYPSCRHTTVASLLSQLSWHTVPHALPTQISTRPSFGMLPPASLSWPVVQGAVGKLQCTVTLDDLNLHLVS